MGEWFHRRGIGAETRHRPTSASQWRLQLARVVGERFRVNNGVLCSSRLSEDKVFKLDLSLRVEQHGREKSTP
jgi:hypothetical protein